MAKRVKDSIERDECPVGLTVLVDAPVSESQRTRIARAFGVARVITPTDLATEPALLRKIDVLFAGLSPPAELASAPRLRWIQTFGAGVDRLLSAAWTQRPGLTVTNARGIHSQAIAEHAFGFILGHIRCLPQAQRNQDRSFWAPPGSVGPLRSLAGATLGILGPGAIGRRVADIGRAFDMRIVGYRRRLEPLPHFERVYRGDELPHFLASTDYLVSILPSTADTRYFLGRGCFEAMRRGAYFVNVGRGDTVDTSALLDALTCGRLSGAGLDVTDPEPLPAGHALWHLPQVSITAHYAGAHPSYEAEATDVFLQNLQLFLSRSKLRNEVDRNAGY
jgi:phosphoglycerate dehydrogenase-like enzyme